MTDRERFDQLAPEIEAARAEAACERTYGPWATATERLRILERERSECWNRMLKKLAQMTLPLYPTEAQIAREVLGPNRVAEWSGIAGMLERDGFPRIDPLFGGRYLPAVRAWLDAYNRVANISPPRRGREKWQEPKSQGSSGASAKPENVYPIGARDQT